MRLWWFVRLSPSFLDPFPRAVSAALEKQTFRERRFHFLLRCKNKSSQAFVYRIFTTHIAPWFFFFLVAPMCIVLGCSSSLCDSKAQFRVRKSQGNPFSSGFPPFSPSHTHKQTVKYSEYIWLVSFFGDKFGVI